MTSTHALLFAAIASMLLSACVPGDSNGSVFEHFSIRDDNVIAHSYTGSDAIVSSNGDLSIDTKPVLVTPVQRKLLQDYYRHVLDLRTNAVGTGKEGARTAIRAIGAVIEGVGNGHPDEIDGKVQRQAKQVEALANKVCMNLAGIRNTQQAIVTEIPAFNPYATIEDQQVKDCGTT